MKVPDTENVRISFSPTFDDIKRAMNDIIDGMVVSVHGLQRVESHLFYQVKGVPVKTINSVMLRESCVESTKLKLGKVIDANCKGPLR